MKTILVDAIYAFVSEDGRIFEKMFDLLESFPNKKILLTGASGDRFKEFGLDKMPYEVFTLKQDPAKSDPKNYKIMLEHFNLDQKDVVYFEHDEEAVKSAQSIGINTFKYDSKRKNLKELKDFITKNL